MTMGLVGGAVAGAEGLVEGGDRRRLGVGVLPATLRSCVMRTPLALLFLLTAVLNKCKGEALKCHTCVAANEEECNRQGSTVCPAHADACSTITGPNSVIKSCSYASFCEKAHMSNGDVKLECCFTNDCNGPHPAHSYRESNAAMSLDSGLTVLFGVLLVRAAVRFL